MYKPTTPKIKIITPPNNHIEIIILVYPNTTISPLMYLYNNKIAAIKEDREIKKQKSTDRKNATADYKIF